MNSFESDWTPGMRWPRVRFTARRMIVEVAIVSACFLLVLSYLFVYEHYEHHEWYRNVEERIVRLADKRPPDMSSSRWAYSIHWTWNLHANYGGYESFDRSERARFLREFDRRLDGKVDLGTIDWIWDEYVKHSSGGRYYSENFRPTDPKNVRAWFTDQQQSYDLNEWLARLKTLRERDEAHTQGIPIKPVPK
jgi:hypothetical protein